MIRSARQIRTGFSLCVFFFLSLSRIIPFFHSFGDNRRHISREISREEPRHIPTIARPYVRLKLKTSIRRERGERERGGYEREKRNKEKKTVDENIKREENKKKKETEEIYSLERPCILRWLLWHSRNRRCSRSKWREETTREEEFKSFLFGVFLLASKTLLDRSVRATVLSRNLIGGAEKQNAKKKKRK